jgi:hypothetical protein
MPNSRPTLPSGYSLAGLPPVVTVIRVDERFELYELETTGGADAALLLVLCPKGRIDGPSGLGDWWALQPRSLLAVLRVLDSEDLPQGMETAVLEMGGQRLSVFDRDSSDEEALHQLFCAMVGLVDGTRSSGMFPDFDPDLVWYSAATTAACALFPASEAPADEAEMVRLVAAAFYRCATGVAIDTSLASPPPFSRWSKHGGGHLSKTVDRCLAPTTSRGGLFRLSGLMDALGCKGPENLDRRTFDLEPAASLHKHGQGFERVAGMHALKELLLREVVAPVRNPEPFLRYGLSIPNGILLFGPPGCGKTYIARQLAEELEQTFIEVIPSEIASSYIHQSVLRIREMFESAFEQAPSVLFIDEFEALVPARDELGGEQQYKAEEVNEFLAHLSSCAERGVLVIAATNEPEKIDAAVRRTGRIDKLVYVGPPDLEAREEMLGLHLGGRPVAAELDTTALAKELAGFSASDIRFLVDEAARTAMQSNQTIGHESFVAALKRVRPSVPPEVEEEYQAIEQRGL